MSVLNLTPDPIVYEDGSLATPRPIGAVRPRFPFKAAPTPDTYARLYERDYAVRPSTYRAGLTIANRTSWANLWTYSEADHADWTKTNVGATTAVANPQDGALTAIPYLETGATGTHRLSRAYTFGSEAWHCMSAFGQYLGRDWIRLQAFDGIQTAEGWFNLSTGETSLYRPVISSTVLNGSFETAGGGGADAFGSWTEAVTGVATVNRDTSVFDTGAASCRLDVDDVPYDASIAQTVLEVGRKYSLTVRVKKTGTAPALTLFDGTTVVSAISLTTSFATVTVAFTALTTTLKLLATNGTASPVSVWIDAVTLTPTLQAPIISTAVLNGGFETAGGGGADVFGSWSEIAVGTAVITRDTAVFDTGAASCRLNVTTGSDTAVVYISGAVQIGRRYRVSVRAKRGAAGTLYVHDSVTNVAVQTLTTSWADYTYDFTAAGTWMAFATNTASAAVWIDSVTLTPLDEPVLTIWQRPGTTFYRCSMAFYPRAGTGSVLIAASNDGSTVSYTGDTTKGFTCWGRELKLGAVPGPYVSTTSAARTISAPDYYSSDIFAWLAEETEMEVTPLMRARFTRFHASIPATQYFPGSKWITRPAVDDQFSGSNWAASVDNNVTFSVFTTRKTITGAPAYVSALVNNYNVVGHGGVEGDEYIMWYGDKIVDRGPVLLVPDANHFYGWNTNLQVSNPATVQFFKNAAARYVTGAIEATSQDVTEFYGLGTSLKAATGGTISADTDIPLQAVQMDPKSWLAAIAAGSTWAVESTQGKQPYRGSILGYHYTRILMADVLDTITP